MQKIKKSRSSTTDGFPLFPIQKNDQFLKIESKIIPFLMTKYIWIKRKKSELLY